MAVGNIHIKNRTYILGQVPLIKCKVGQQQLMRTDDIIYLECCGFVICGGRYLPNFIYLIVMDLTEYQLSKP